MPLSDLQAQNAKPRDRDYKLPDSGGLYLLVKKNGSRLWRQKYRFDGREKLLAHGQYPQVSLANARQRRDRAKEMLQTGRDPGAERRAAKTVQGDSFEHWARAWYANRVGAWEPAHADRVLSRLENDAIRALGAKPIGTVTLADLLGMLRAIEDRGAITMAKRVKGYCHQVFDFAVSEGGVARNPVADIGKRVLKPSPRTEHFAKLTIDELPEFFRDLRGFGSQRTQLAILLTILTWTRTNEMQFARVDEFEFDGEVPLWRIAKERMKMRRPHLIPLSGYAVDVARRLIGMTGGEGPLFGAAGMSNTTMLQAIYSIGWRGRTTMHGMRGLASTWANEALTPAGDRRYQPDWVEMQLAHEEGDAVRSAYNSAEYLAARRRMMQDWSDVVEAAWSRFDHSDLLG